MAPPKPSESVLIKRSCVHLAEKGVTPAVKSISLSIDSSDLDVSDLEVTRQRSMLAPITLEMVLGGDSSDKNKE